MADRARMQAEAVADDKARRAAGTRLDISNDEPMTLTGGMWSSPERLRRRVDYGYHPFMDPFAGTAPREV